MSDILVSIICLTYNHVDIIHNALDGFIMQKTHFPFEVIIHDDASTDGNQDVIKKYANMYPNIIKPIFRQDNYYSQTEEFPMKFTYPYCSGKYIADCDGDDYWTDRHKLQKQIDFLENNKQYSMCHHSYKIIKRDSGIVEEPKGTPKDYNSLDMIRMCARGYGINVSTRMRRNFYKGNEEIYEMCDGDITMVVLMGMFGDCKFLPNIEPSIYRQFYNKNSWSSSGKVAKKLAVDKANMKIIKMLEKVGNQQWIDIRKNV